MRCPQLKRGRQCRLPLGHHTMHVYTELSRTGLLARIGRRTKRDRPAIDRCRQQVKERSEGLCEAIAYTADIPGCDVHAHRGHHMHHLRKADRAEGKHLPDRCVWLCKTAHDWVELHPESARQIGLWVDSWDDLPVPKGHRQ